MREILFRGKRCDNGEWVQGFYVRADHHWHKNGIHKDWIICGASANGGWFALHNKYAVKAETVGQFTGLTDKNGKKIFEGDIIGYHAQGDIFVNFGVVCWDEEDARWAYQLNTMKPGFYMHNPNTVEVIGNIHDNPKLLEGGVEDG